MKGWNGIWRTELDQSIIIYNVSSGEVFGGSNPGRTVKQVQKVDKNTDFDGNYHPIYSDGHVPSGDYTLELDLSNRSLVMEINNKKITLDDNLGDFEYSPIVIGYNNREITLL